MKKFSPNKNFRRDYDRLFRECPETANLFLLLAELSDEGGQAVADEAELAVLMAARFNDPAEYALGGDADD